MSARGLAVKWYVRTDSEALKLAAYAVFAKLSREDLHPDSRYDPALEEDPLD